MPSENQKIQFTLGDLYKTLKKHDSEILKHFNEAEISDQLYLFYGINSDIMSNGLSVVMNLLYHNNESIGIDQSCRSLIESFVILKMIASGAVSDLQAKLYRYQYSLVDKDNFRGKLTEEDKKRPEYQKVLEDSNAAFDILSELYGLSRKAVRSIKDLDDPNLYLKRSPADNINFASLLAEYPIFDERSTRIYEFFSLFTHPRFEMKPELEDGFFRVREAHIHAVLDYLVRYLASSKLLVKDDSISSFDEDFTDNPVLLNNRNNIQQIDIAFHYIADKTCFFDEGWDSYTFMYLGQMRALVIDLMISESLGYREHVIGKFKPFLEYFSVYSTLGSIEDLDEFRIRKIAFCYSSRLQVIEHLKSMGLCDNETFLPQVRDVYDAFYGKAYGVDFDTFYKRMAGNSVYFLRNDERKSYNAIVKASIAKVIPEQDQELVFFLYKLAKDMSHAGGYNFNSSPGLSDFYYRVVMRSVWKIMIEHLACAELTLKDHGITVDFGAILKTFQLFMEAEENEAIKEREALKKHSETDI